MSKNINLLPRKNVDILRREKILNLYRFISTLFLLIVCFLSIGLFLLNKNSPVYSLENEKDSLLKAISQLSERTSKFLFINARLQDISEILSKRTYMDKTLDLIMKEIPDNVLIKSISVDKNKLSLSVSSNSLSSINTLLDNLVNLVSSKKSFNKIILSGISLDKSSKSYVLSITLIFI